MPLNKVSPNGNMYSWITHTWNTVKGECPHGCHYCYMKKWGEQPPLKFDEKELKTDLGSGNFHFVGSSCDMWANEIPNSWISQTLRRCGMFNNRYLFQSKNPQRILENHRHLPKDVVVGTTIESDMYFDEMGDSPHPEERAKYLATLQNLGLKTMVTIEPVMDFNVLTMTAMIAACMPAWVNIGANTSHKVKLKEPRPELIHSLVENIKHFTEVKIKPNLNRLFKV